MRYFVLLVLFISASVSAESESPWLDWVAANAPHGIDITNDGTIWISLHPIGQKNDYALRAEDLFEARRLDEANPSFWIRGFHKKNTDVRWRETKARYVLDCTNERISTSVWLAYDAEGNVISETGYVSPEYIVREARGQNTIGFSV